MSNALLRLRQLFRATSLFPRSTDGPHQNEAPGFVNDIHSQLNPTRVERIVSPASLDTLRETVVRAQQQQQTLCIAGARHSMGGQQFATDGVLIDTTNLDRVLDFDAREGKVTVEAGITWPALVNFLIEAQQGQVQQWGIAQKQTGADRLCLGGALSSNIHGRGLQMKPLISDVEAFDLMDAEGQMHHCSRTSNPELFRLAIGGYGLFGIIYCVTLRLARRQKVQRVVEIRTLDGLMDAFDERINDGFLYGDFQFMTDEKSEGFLRRGVFSCYRPVDPATPLPKRQKQVSERVWRELVFLAHADKAKAYRLYTQYYLSTTGQIYWSDLHQLSAYLDNYHQKLDRRLGASHAGSEVITELYVPRASLHLFMDEARDDFRANGVNIIYGTIRLIEQDDESFLAWATQPFACVIFNLHTDHTPQGKEHSAQAFRRLIDIALRYGGSYYLTYHRHATRQQVEQCYPQFAELLELKKRYDPQQRFQSDWYRHYQQMFALDEDQSGGALAHAATSHEAR
jgi:FAD/FMN-containing dehydrogenase